MQLFLKEKEKKTRQNQITRDPWQKQNQNNCVIILDHLLFMYSCKLSNQMQSIKKYTWTFTIPTNPIYYRIGSIWVLISYEIHLLFLWVQVLENQLVSLVMTWLQPFHPRDFWGKKCYCPICYKVNPEIHKHWERTSTVLLPFHFIVIFLTKKCSLVLVESKSFPGSTVCSLHL